MKRLFVILMIALLGFSFFSCSAKKSAKTELIIGTNAEYPPFEFKKDNNFVGIDMELAKLLAKKLGMTYKIIDMDFDSIIPSLSAKKLDLALSAITITDKRKKQIDFSIPYYTTNQAIVTKKDRDIVIKSEKDFKKYKIGVQNGTTGQIYFDKNIVGKIMPKNNFKKYATNIEAISDMLNGNIDLVILDDTAAMGYAKLKPLKTVYMIKTNESYGIALQKNSPLKTKIDNALKEILASEEWAKIIQKYIK